MDRAVYVVGFLALAGAGESSTTKPQSPSFFSLPLLRPSRMSRAEVTTKRTEPGVNWPLWPSARSRFCVAVSACLARDLAEVLAVSAAVICGPNLAMSAMPVSGLAAASAVGYGVLKFSLRFGEARTRPWDSKDELLNGNGGRSTWQVPSGWRVRPPGFASNSAPGRVAASARAAAWRLGSIPFSLRLGLLETWR